MKKMALKAGVVACFLLLFILPLNVRAAEKQVVRVGIFDYQAFYGEDGAGNPRGYGYEYLNMLEKYGDFEYEYVYGSWGECLEWLESGEIDMLDSAQKYEERQKKFLFSKYSTGTSFGELCVASDNTGILYNDFEAIDGMKVGMLENSGRNDTFFEFAKRNDFSVQPVMYKTEQELSQALLGGEVEGIVSSNLRRGANERSVARFAPTPFYLIFNEKQTVLKEQMDDALESILIDYPEFNFQLSEKYYKQDNESLAFTKEETKFAAESPVLKVVYTTGWEPFVTYDQKTGKTAGISVEILELIGEQTGLEFEFLNGYSYAQAASMVADGEADLLLGFEAAEHNLENDQLSASDVFLNVPLCLVGRALTVAEDAVFALPKQNPEMLQIIKEQFPEGTIMLLDSMDACYEAVRSEQAEFTMDNIYSAADKIEHTANHELGISFVSSIGGHYSIGLRQDVNPTLVRILNKGILSVDQSELTKIFTKYTSYKAPKVTVLTWLYEQRIFVIIAAVVFFVMIGFLGYWGYKRYQKRQKKLWEETYIDSLTGTANFKLFKREARQLLDSAGMKYVICKFDIENFKLINEIYGFECGDWIIQVLSQVVQSVADPACDACARISGDNFIILKSYKERKENRRMLVDCEREICEQVGQEFSSLIKLKYGMYYIEDNTERLDSILEKANYAHSICKASPGNKYIYNESAKQNAIEEKKIEARMEEALANRQFILYLQPKYNLSDESLAGAEALVRWSSADSDKLIYPNAFIPLFEKNGFIVKLDMYMLELTCELIRSWMDSGQTPVTVSINFSRLHLMNSNFTKDVCVVVDRFDIPRNYIEIELTESAMFDNEEAMFDMLEGLHAEGFSISMDDFGTGYSSLGLLKNLPVDVIKIDRSFFADSRFKERANTVIGNVIQMTKKLEIHTVAEGVESQEHIDLLREMGCEIVQGYYFAKPMPASQFRLDATAKPKIKTYNELRIEAEELGDLSLGRQDLGDMISVFSYRLFQVAVRKTLSDLYGEGEMEAAMRKTGMLAGSTFARQYLDLQRPFQELVLELTQKLKELKIGHMVVEQFDLETGEGMITFSNDADCSGIEKCDKTLCQYDEGFIAGILSEYTQKRYAVKEVDCWGTGAAICRFEIKAR